MDTRLFRRPHIIRYESTCYALSHVDSSILVHPDLLTLGKSDDDDKDFDECAARKEKYLHADTSWTAWLDWIIFIPCAK